jgi:hypothetical protein
VHQRREARNLAELDALDRDAGGALDKNAIAGGESRKRDIVGRQSIRARSSGDCLRWRSPQSRCRTQVTRPLEIGHHAENAARRVTRQFPVHDHFGVQLGDAGRQDAHCRPASTKALPPARPSTANAAKPSQHLDRNRRVLAPANRSA